MKRSQSFIKNKHKRAKHFAKFKHMKRKIIEHPSGLSGEHDVVLDAIHEECLHGR